MSRSRVLFRHAMAAAMALFLAGTAQAQVSSATIKGQVSDGAAPAPAGTSVVAVNKSSGFTYRTTTLADGSYVLAALPPGEYELRVASAAGTAKTQVLTLQVGETAAVNLALSKTEEIVVTGVRRKDVKSSEVGTNVSRKMIEVLPQATHNFLDSADLAPGVAFVQDQATGNTHLQAGAQNHDNVNVFVDGVGQKNNILRGGVTGQDSSRGNPFPQSAIAGFKVITQNYKAEYDQVSSAAITAITKSGSNEVHGDAYYDSTRTEWRSESPLELQKEQAGQVLPSSNKGEYGFDLGGPIKQDVANYFLAYDGKDINDGRQVVPKNLNMLPANQGIVPRLAALGGTYVDPFAEHLLFGKVNTELAGGRKLTATVKLRMENDRIPEDRILSSAANFKNRYNDEFRADLLHEWSLGSAWVSESRAGYQDAVWNPKTAANTPFIKYKVANNTANLLSDSSDVIWDGGSPDRQRREQSGVTLAQDVTFMGLPHHVFKSGAKLGLMKYDLSGTARTVDVVQTLVDTTTGNPYYDGTNCTGTNVSADGSSSDQCRIDRALAPASVSIDNAQIGLYLQDDWDITSKLEINVGARWDYETNMLNNGYVTPADRVAALYGPDTRSFNCPGPNCIQGTGAPYADALAKGGINIADYIANGHSRKPFTGAFAPRLGASYDVFGDKSTVVFGGYGRSYDRTMANHALDEKQKNAQAGGEIWLIRNDFKMPYTDQYSIGVRQAVLNWNVELTVSQMDAKNQFQWFGGNRDPNGGWATQAIFDPLWGGPQGYGTLVLGDFIGQTRAFSTMLKVEKPYTKASGWTASLAYTYTDAQTKHNDWNDDIFDWTYGKPNRAWHPSTLIDKSRLVAAGMVDDLLPWGFAASAKYTFGSGLARKATACPTGWGAACQTGGVLTNLDNSPIFSQLDVGVAKAFRTTSGTFTFRADVLNVLNRANYLLNTNVWGGGQPSPGAPANQIGGDNLALNTPDTLRGPMRTVLMTGTYSF